MDEEIKKEILKRHFENYGVRFEDYPILWIDDAANAKQAIYDAMEEYSQQNCDVIHNLFNRPAEKLNPLEELYRKEHPDPEGRFYTPDRTKFYEWIVTKILKN